MNVITVASNKGGVGKTTTAASLAAALGSRKPTLLIDFDSQGQVSLWFGSDPAAGVFRWWGGEDLAGVTVAAEAYPYLWLLPGNSRTKAVEKEYRNVIRSTFVHLVERIRRLREHFDYLIIDTSPAGFLQELAIAAADEIVVPFKAEAPGVDGALGTGVMLEAMNHQARVTYLAVDFYRAVLEQQRSLADLGQRVGTAALAPMPVPHRIAVAEAVAMGQTIWAYPSKSLDGVRDAYSALLDHLLHENQWLGAKEGVTYAAGH